MKERGGGNGSDRSRWAGDGLLEIWGAQSCWLIWSVCSFLGRRRSAPVQVQVQAQAQAHRTTCTHIRSLLHFCTGLFWPTRVVSSLTACPGTPRPQRRTASRQGQAGKATWCGNWLAPTLSFSSISSVPRPQAAHAWALTEVIHLFSLPLSLSPLSRPAWLAA